VLRRTSRDASPAASGSIVAGQIEIDLDRREVKRADRPVHLTRKEFDLLSYLVAAPGVTFTRAQLLDDVWDFAWHGDSATVTVHVRRLREKIEDDPSNPRHLVTVWGVGYRFEP
jgi:DNA-binding response OmpR family regulator